jgi:hypothetical protein
MDFESILIALAGLHPALPVALSALGALVVIAQIVVLVTPSPKDNELMAKLEGIPMVGQLLKALKSFAPKQK